MKTYSEAVTDHGEDEVKRDVNIWWLAKSNRQKYNIMVSNLIIRGEENEK